MQRYTSQRTCRKQVPALHRALLRAGVWKAGDVNADIGGGKWELATEALDDQDVENIVYDPYNRSDEHNTEALQRISQGVKTATVANTLNAIVEPEARAGVIQLAAQAASVAYFHIYEGNGSGVGSETRDGWQENRGLESYIPEMSPLFSRVVIRRIGGLRVIEATA